MPELPDVMLYLAALKSRIVGQPLERVRLASPFLLRSVGPKPEDLEGRAIIGIDRLGKRIVWDLEDDLYVVIHLMIAGRLHWRPRGSSVPRRVGLAAFDFPAGTLLLTEAGAKKRASLHIVQGHAAIAALDPGGLDPLTSGFADFAERLRSENRTLKRALTDPRILSGIGNAYSDEILHAARLSPQRLTSRLSDHEIAGLLEATVATLSNWTAQLVERAGDAFPEKVTAFRDGMAVHGRYGKPCPRCGSIVQRIAYANNECNYCATCQTAGRLLADRSVSRLLGRDWPRTLEELESSKRR